MSDGIPYGDFLLLEKLAVGGMGEIFLASPREPGRLPERVALKRVHPAFRANPEFLGLFLDEAKVAAQAAHPNLLKVFELGIAEDELYLAMEYVQGANLNQLLERVAKAGEQFPWPICAAIGVRLCRALQHAHALTDLSGRPLGVVHRDVNPSNVMLSVAGEVKLIDFGIAKAATQSELTRQGMVKVKQGYASPEQVTGGPVDWRTDLYGAGLTLYDLLTRGGRFGTQSAGALRGDQLPPVEVLRSQLPPRLVGILSACLQASPSLRPASAASVSEELAACLADANEQVDEEALARFLLRYLPQGPGPGPSPGRPATAVAMPQLGSASSGSGAEPTLLVTSEESREGITAGVRVGRYEVMEPLAAGGMGQIWRARTRGTGQAAQWVALKTIAQEHMRNPDFVSRFLDEARLAALVNHPNVARVLGHGEHAGQYYIAMEFLEGTTLRELLKVLAATNRRVPERLAAHLAAECCAGLEFTHNLVDASGRALSVVHRDVSADNIFLTYDGRTKLLDFGVAKSALSRHETTIGELVGKRSYLAPEQIRHEQLDRRTDIWGMGVVLYLVLAGRRPFQENSEAALFEQILHGEPPPLSAFRPGLTDGIQAIVARALAKNPPDRFPTAGELREELLQLAGTYPVTRQEVAQWLAGIYPEQPSGVSVGPQDATGASVETSSGPRTFGPTGRLRPLPEGRRLTGRHGLVAAALLAMTAAAGLVWQFGPQEELPVAGPQEGLPAVGPKVAPVSPGRVTPEAPVALEEKPPVAAPGGLAIRSNARCQVSVDGKPRGWSPLTVASLPPGEHKVRCALAGANGAAPLEALARVLPGQVARVTFSFRKGELLVKVLDAWADVSVNGRAVGQTPMPPLQLFEGSYVVRLENPELNRAKEIPVRIAAGRTERLSINLRE